MVTGRFEGILPPMWLFSRDLPQNNDTRSLDDSTYEMRVGVKVIDCPPKINMYRGPGGGMIFALHFLIDALQHFTFSML